MEKIRTTLLISDDLDDHQSFTEAFQKVSPSMVVVAVLSQDKAMALLESGKLVPDYIFFDATLADSDLSEFLLKVKLVQAGKKISLTVYGDEDVSGGITKFNKDYDFPELVKFFEDLLRQLHD